MKLNLAEELLLLGMQDEKGTVVLSAGTALPYGLGGALLMELMLEDRLDLADEKVIVIDPSLTGDDVLDEALANIQQSKRNRKSRYWVERFCGVVDPQDRLLERLVTKGILRREEHRILWVIPTQRYPTDEEEPELEVRARVRAAVRADDPPDTRTTLLLSLVDACDLVGEIWSKGERKPARKRIKELVAGEPIGKAVSDTVAMILAAVIAASTAATAAAT
jgi:hypothetical protein